MTKPNREHVPEIGQPIYLEYVDHPMVTSQFVTGEYRGETARSWVVGHEWCPERYAKAKTRRLMSRNEYERLRDEAAWVRMHAYRISGCVQRAMDYSKLKQIAEIVGYEEGK